MAEWESGQRPKAVVLADRGVLAVSGRDREAFLQGLITNDVRKVAAGRAIWAALLTAQGRYLHDFFVYPGAHAWLLEGERARLGDLVLRLGRFRLRADVAFADESAALAVAAAWGPGAARCAGLADAAEGTVAPFAGEIAAVDPRRADAGIRLVVARDGAEDALRAAGFEPDEVAAYHRHRIALGLADGSRDLEVEKTLPLEAGFDAANGIDWDKGCYLGQEVTARSKYRGLVKRRLVTVAVEGSLPPPGTAIVTAGRSVGEIRSGVDGLALAFIRLDVLADPVAAGGLRAGEARLTVLAVT